jgi:hypothetical protein
MPDRRKEPRKRGDDELPDEELEAQRGSQLPDREALSVLSADVAIPADPAIAADVLSGEDPPDHPEDVPAGDDAPPAEDPPPED